VSLVIIGDADSWSVELLSKVSSGDCPLVIPDKLGAEVVVGYSEFNIFEDPDRGILEVDDEDK
jgi:hypothetical protein